MTRSKISGTENGKERIALIIILLYNLNEKRDTYFEGFSMLPFCVEMRV